MEVSRFFIARISDETLKYPIKGRERGENYAIYRTGSCAGGQEDGPVYVSEELRAARAKALFGQHLHHKNP